MGRDLHSGTGNNRQNETVVRYDSILSCKVVGASVDTERLTGIEASGGFCTFVVFSSFQCCGFVLFFLKHIILADLELSL